MNPLIRDFILFCIKRRGDEWPAIYDEMSIVAGQQLFRNLNHAELKKLGLSLQLNDLDKTSQLVSQVLSQIKQM